jgi:hypothetical protein
MGGDGGWTTQSLLGTTKWAFRNSSMFHAGNNGYSDYKTAMDDWLISPVITCTNFDDLYMRFEHQLPVLNGVYNAYQVYFSTSTSNTFIIDEWHLLGELKSFPNSYEWSNKFPILQIRKSSFRIAFRYNAPDKDVEAYNWNIRKVEIRN